MTKNEFINVVKRNGTIELLDLEKIHKIVETACDGITGVSVSDIEMKAHLSFYDGITTKEINQALIKSAADLISENTPNYQYVAANLLNYEIRKDVWGGINPPRLFDHINKMIDSGYYTSELLEFYTEDEWDKIDSFIDHDRDFKFAHIGLVEYITKYAIRDRTLKNVQPLETPQFTYILIAAILFAQEKSLKAVKSYYNDISLWNISLPTPIMAGVRTNTKQFSSCTLIECDDSLKSITDTASAIVTYASKKAGIGIDASAIRSEGSSVGKEKTRHTGVTPFYRYFESALKSCAQGGVRGASATLYTMLWHSEIEDILVLKNNKGTPDNRVRKLDYAIQINNYLYNRFLQNKNITLFSPNDVPELREAFFGDQEKFAKLYEMYEKDSSIKKKSVSSVDIFTKLMIERKETGRIYIFNVDNVNNHSAFTLPIKMSNLCLTGDTRINTNLGNLTLKELYDNKSKFKVISDRRAFENNLILGKKSSKGSEYKKYFGTAEMPSSEVVLTNKNAEVFSLKTEHGYQIKATLDHKIMTEKGMKPLKDITVDDFVYIQSDEGIFSSNYNLSKFNYDVNNAKLPTIWSKELGEFLGWMTGSGFISKSTSKTSKKVRKTAHLIFDNDNYEMKEYFINYLSTILSKDSFYEEKLGNSVQLKIIDRDFITWLETMGVGYRKNIPTSIWSAPRSAQVGFIQGLFTSNGEVNISNVHRTVNILLSDTKKQLLTDIQIILGNFGIKGSVFKLKRENICYTSNTKKEVDLYKVKPIYSLKIRKSNINLFMEKIKFLTEEKNEKILSNLKLYENENDDIYEEKYMSKVTSIQYHGVEEVYDIGVPESHSFIANNIAVHNCTEITLLTKPMGSEKIYEKVIEKDSVLNFIKEMDSNSYVKSYKLVEEKDQLKFNIIEDISEIALCTLSAINLGNVRSLDDLETICRNAVRGLDNLLDYQDYLLPASRRSTENYRPLGIGIVNLAYYLAKNGCTYSDTNGHVLIHETMEAIQFYLIKASIELAKERGPCKAIENTTYGRGLLPIDHYNKNVDEIVKPKYNLNWEWLRGELIKYGIRNATISAQMPAESSAKIMNATNGVDKLKALIITKSNKSNVSKQVAPEITRLKNKYDISWESVSNEGFIKSMAVKQKFGDQAISTSLSYNPIHYPNNEIPLSILVNDLLMANKFGLKTLYYLYTNDQRDMDITETPKEINPISPNETDTCDACTI